MRIVLDTNVVVSGLIWGGTPRHVLRAAIDGDHAVYTSPALLTELRTVLSREHLTVRLKQQYDSVEEALVLFAALTVAVTPTTTPRVVVADMDDDQVIAAAVAADADLIVSGDRHLTDIGTHGRIRIVTPIMALTLLTATNQ